MLVAVSLDVAMLQGPTSYTLRAATLAPDHGGCAQAHPIAGVGPVSVAPANGGGSDAGANGGRGGGLITFHWPSTLPAARYWLCATPLSPNEPALAATQPFTALTAAPPTLRIDARNQQLTAGASFSVAMRNWQTPDNTTPYVYLAPARQPIDDNATILLSPRALPSTTELSSGTYTLQFQLSATTTPGAYLLVSAGQCDKGLCLVREQSEAFTVVAPPTAPASPPPSALSTWLSRVEHPAVVTLALGGLLALLLLWVALSLAWRSRTRAPTQLR